MKQRLFAKTCNISCLLIGLIQFSFGLLILLNFDNIFHFILKSALDLSPGSTAFNEWRTNDPPLIMDLYFFNWTNPHEIRKKGIKPRFQEIGPYRFEEVKEKVDIVYFPHNDSMSFKYVKRYYFMEEQSPRKLDDKLTIINMVPLSAAYKFRYKDWFAKRGLSFALSQLSRLYETRTAREWLFEGFVDKFLATAHTFQDVPDKFGWFYARNNVGPPDVYTFHTKYDQDFGKMLMVNHRNRTDYFDGKCGELHGSAGEFHPPYSKRSHISIFNAEMCTYQHLYYEEDINVKGINAYKFSASQVFDNGKINPENACYCKGECLPYGVLNVSSCRGNTPVFLSLPHFYGADPSYAQAVEGLNPNKKQHEFYLALEPTSSIITSCAGRMQLNVYLQPIDGIPFYYNVPKVMMPIFYFDQIFVANDTLASNLRIIQMFPDASRIASIVFIILGTALTSFGVIYMILKQRQCDESNTKKLKYKIELQEASIPLKC